MSTFETVSQEKEGGRASSSETPPTHDENDGERVRDEINEVLRSVDTIDTRSVELETAAAMIERSKDLTPEAVTAAQEQSGLRAARENLELLKQKAVKTLQAGLAALMLVTASAPAYAESAPHVSQQTQESNNNTQSLEDHGGIAVDLTRERVDIGLESDRTSINVERNSKEIDLTHERTPVDLKNNKTDIGMESDRTSIDLSPERVPVELKNNEASIDLTHKEVPIDLNRNRTPITLE